MIPTRGTFRGVCASPASGAARVPSVSPKRNVRRSIIDDLVGPDQQRLRDREPERLRGLVVDDQLELRGLLDREVGGFGALENPVDVDRGASEEYEQLWPIRHQTAAF